MILKLFKRRKLFQVFYSLNSNLKMSCMREIISCKGCLFEGQYILKHLVSKKLCKSLYSETELTNLKDSSKAITAANRAIKKKQLYDLRKGAKKYQDEKKTDMNGTIQVKKSLQNLEEEALRKHKSLEKKTMDRFQHLSGIAFSKSHKRDLEFLELEAKTLAKQLDIEVKAAIKKVHEILGCKYLESNTKEAINFLEKLLEKISAEWKNNSKKISDVLDDSIHADMKSMGMI